MEKKTVSGTMLTVLLMCMLTLAFNIQLVMATGTIYIRPDGSVEGTDKIQRDGNTYTFTDDIYDSIAVERDNIAIDGNGHLLQGVWAPDSRGVDLTQRTNVTVRDIEIDAFYTGIWLNHSLNNCISENNMSLWSYGSPSYCIYLGNSSGNIISENHIFALNHCILLDYSSNNSISGNDVAAGDTVICLCCSPNNTVSGNHVGGSDGNGISLDKSSNNNIYGNDIGWGDGIGISLDKSSNNNIYGNNIIHKISGISLGTSSNNSIYGNNIKNHWSGFYISGSSSNILFHNNLVGNNQQVVNYDSANLWEDGYPSGGNYWSDYTGVDVESGPNQDHSGSDGIGDTPHIIDTNNQDNYPLMTPWIGIVTATIDIKPESLSLKARPTWIMVYIELPAVYSPRDIDVSTIRLNGVVQAELKPIAIGDYDGDGVLDFMVKFKAADVMPLLHVDIYRFTVTGEVNSGLFEASDTIKVKA